MVVIHISERVYDYVRSSNFAHTRTAPLPVNNLCHWRPLPHLLLYIPYTWPCFSQHKLELLIILLLHLLGTTLVSTSLVQFCHLLIKDVSTYWQSLTTPPSLWRQSHFRQSMQRVLHQTSSRSVNCLLFGVSIKRGSTVRIWEIMICVARETTKKMDSKFKTVTFDRSDL